MIDQDIINRVRERASAFDVIQTFSSIQLKKDGANYKACCPFHGEKTPSFIVSPAKNIWKCFGCGMSGDGISFVMQDQHLDFMDAVRALARHYSIEVPGSDNAVELKVINNKIITEQPLTAAEKKLLAEKEAEKISKQLFHLKKNTKELAGAYLQSRGLSIEMLPAGSFYQGSAFRNEATGIEFPVSVAFLDSSEKFINKRFIGQLPEGIGKSRNTGIMCNKVFDKCFQKSAKNVFITEGVINAMSISQTGRSSLATFATSNEFDNPGILATYLSGKNVFMAFDNDKAGLIYAVKFSKFLFDNHDIINPEAVFAVIFPENADANDCLVDGTLESVLSDKFYRVPVDRRRADYEYKLLKEARETNKAGYVPKLKPVNLFNYAMAKKHIAENDLCYITEETSGKYKKPNTIGFNADYPESLFFIKQATSRIVLIDKMPDFYDSEPRIYHVCKLLVGAGFNLKVMARVQNTDDYDLGTHEEEISFISFYIDRLRSNINEMDIVSKTDNIKKAAEFMALLDAGTYTVEYTSVYKKFGLNKADWNTIAKEYLTKEKHRQIYSGSDDDDNINIADLMDINKLPGYVDLKEFYKQNYFAVQNKQGKEIFYMFKSADGNLFPASNFAMKMIGHLYHNEKDKNKRIMMLTDENGKDYYIEVKSTIIRSFDEFSNRIYDEGALFFFGTKRQYLMLLKNVSANVPLWHELEILGQHDGEFFAFSDGLYDYNDKKFLPIDELGTIKFKGITYYIPAFSSIYSNMMGNSDLFSSSKFLKFNKTRKGHDFNHTTFYEWTKLMDDVYKEDNAGKFAVVFVILSAFRDFVHKLHNRFPLFFLSGPPNMGKSKIAESIQAVFAKGMQFFNLNSGTDAAFFVNLEKYRNIPMIFDEYNDVQISKIKFQGLKAGYDGIGKQKKKEINSNELAISEVNCSIVYLGQEIPEQDDYALFTRSLSFFIPSKNFTQKETRVFEELKKKEEIGLTNILIEILNYRPIFIKHYYTYQMQIKEKLKSELQEGNFKFMERILNSVSEFLAALKIFSDHTQVNFAFDYEDFYRIAFQKCIKLSEMIQEANKLANFFNTINVLFNQGKITRGKEFKIEARKGILVRKNSNENEEIFFKEETKIIFIRINLIYPLYHEMFRNESLKVTLLGTYLKDSQAYIGSAINEDFEWFEPKIVEKQGESGPYKTQQFVASRIRNTTAIAFIYDKLDLQLEKFTDDENTIYPATATVGTKQAVVLQDDLPF